jgi:hypothetical protein
VLNTVIRKVSDCGSVFHRQIIAKLHEECTDEAETGDGGLNNDWNKMHADNIAYDWHDGGMTSHLVSI